MKQHEFETQHQALWQRIEAALEKPSQGDNAKFLAEQYLHLCQQLAIAKERMYDGALLERLNKLALELYRELYRYVSLPFGNPAQFFRVLQARLSTRDLSAPFLYFDRLPGDGVAGPGCRRLDIPR